MDITVKKIKYKFNRPYPEKGISCIDTKDITAYQIRSMQTDKELLQHPHDMNPPKEFLIGKYDRYPVMAWVGNERYLISKIVWGMLLERHKISVDIWDALNVLTQTVDGNPFVEESKKKDALKKVKNELIRLNERVEILSKELTYYTERNGRFEAEIEATKGW